MARAGVFIGVDKTGQLQTLNDAAAGAARMHAWAIDQGMVDGTNARLITDAGGQPVTATAIIKAIKALVDGAGVDSLMVYFAGHGVNIHRSERWLLTEAPDIPSEAVNVAASVDFARYCGVPYTVFISDACRVAPEGIQAQGVEGVSIFPNNDASDRARPVDQFFACRLGRTAAEIRGEAPPTVGEVTSAYSALYTSALLDALSGKAPRALAVGDDGAQYVKPAPLAEFLEAEIPRRIPRDLRGAVNQSPEAIVTVHDKWLSRVTGIEVVRGGGPVRPKAASPAAAVRGLIQVAATDSPAAFDAAIEQARVGNLPGIDELATTAARVAAPFGPDHHETQCGIKVQGRSIAEVVLRKGHAERADAEGTDYRISPGVSIQSGLVVFDDGSATVVPVAEGWLTALTFDGPELVNVALEPSSNHGRWYDFQQHIDELRTLRGLAAAASRVGRFRLDGPTAQTVAQRMQYAKGYDPGLAVYAAYAYHDQQEMDRLRQMSAYLRMDLDAGLFDVAMLARELRNQPIARAGVVPFVPMLAQGWPLVESSGVRLFPEVERLGSYASESLWSLYTGAGVDMLRAAMRNPEVM
jgi:hypothetical protein